MESFNQNTLRRIQKNDPTLRVLRISDIATPNPNHGEVGMYVPGSDDIEELARLRDIETNTYLESVCIDGDRGLQGATTRAICHGVKRNVSVRNLSLCRCNLSTEDGAAREILSAFGERGDNNIVSGRNNPLASVSLHRCTLSNGGMTSLATMLHRCPNICTVRLTESRGNLRLHGGPGPHPTSLFLNHVLDESLGELVSALAHRIHLEELDVGHNDILGRESCMALAALLKDPTCNLITLRLENNLIDGDCAAALADALTRNDKLKNLYLHGNPIFGNTSESEDDGNDGSYDSELEDAFSRVLCDTSTIMDTYSSNHTLQSFASFKNWEAPPFLELNRKFSEDKRQVARLKILRHHDHIDMELFFGWGPKMLPVAVSWFDEARKCGEDVTSLEKKKLSAIFQFAKAMPMVFMPVLHHLGTESEDRKWEKMEKC
mmetsp:Transcript_21474/g.36881  ORF Transcript_21474/g.36881 Transcript_21474/m.36881 type:complete len:434 (-) Transcript_21474:860-2161(-)|eukprot:CAMPEP_0183779914 /NCGR_PEP_ID=MMETSP0739-20130205/55031_1 /TAXON_ID=385413 /ORGANISM="Thalassiosira miniscula, Strain CCMP1093" /LENGTH=433 /DNA_ID=CAMNT_0026022711 /DNA_START=159 /DNA_END=1460 /DNA_ORIENTATION=-